MDIALAVEQIYKDADFGIADTYQSLKKSWRDNRPIPSEPELATAWVAVLLNKQIQDEKDAVLESQYAYLKDAELSDQMSFQDKVDLLMDVVRGLLPEGTAKIPF